MPLPLSPRQLLPTLAFTLLALVPRLLPQADWPALLVLLAIVLRAGDALSRQRLPPRWLLYLLLPVPMLVLWLDRQHSGSDAAVSFLLILTAFKLLETRSPRDARLTVCIACFVAATQFLFAQTIWHGVWLALLVGGAALALAAISQPLSWRSAVRLCSGLAWVSLPLALALFVLLPRLPAPLWSMTSRDETASTGLGDSVELGRLGEMVKSSAPAFRVRFAGAVPPPSQRYWRADVFWHFDGHRWDSGREPAPLALPAPGAVAYRYSLTPAPGALPDRRLPALDWPAALPAATELTDVLTVRWRDPGVPGAAVELAAAARPPIQRLHGETLAEALTLPAGNPLARQLAHQLRADSGSDRAFVAALLRRFGSAPFRYTLRPPALGPDAIDDFLFRTRAGFCEHYAATFAFLARAAGVPARLVVGWQGGEWNPDGGYLLVRQSDAHAWVEVWLGGAGWHRVDPTAAVAPERIEHDLAASLPPAEMRELPYALWGGPPWLESARRMWDAAQFRWGHWVVGFGTERQTRLLGWLDLSPRPAVLTALLALAVGVVLLFWGWRWRRETLRLRDPLTAAWRRVERRLAAVGLVRRRAEGPLDYAARVGRIRPELKAAVTELAQEYAVLRYGRPGGDRIPRLRRFEEAARRFRVPSSR